MSTPSVRHLHTHIHIYQHSHTKSCFQLARHIACAEQSKRAEIQTHNTVWQRIEKYGCSCSRKWKAFQTLSRYFSVHKQFSIGENKSHRVKTWLKSSENSGRHHQTKSTISRLNKPDNSNYTTCVLSVHTNTHTHTLYSYLGTYNIQTVYYILQYTNSTPKTNPPRKQSAFFYFQNT